VHNAITAGGLTYTHNYAINNCLDT